MSSLHAARATVAPHHFALVLAGCFTFVFYGPALLPSEWSFAHSRHAAWNLSIGYSNALLIFLCVANSRWSFVLGVPLLLVACTLGAYAQWRWGSVIDSNVIGALLEADRYETKTFLTWDVWVLLLGSASVGITISTLYVKWCWYRQNWVQGFQHAYILFALAVTLAFANQQLEGSETDFDDMLVLAPAIAMGAALFLFIEPRHLGRIGRIAVWAGLFATVLLALSYARLQEPLWMMLCAGGLMGAWSVCSARYISSQNGCAHTSAAHTLGMAFLLMPAFIDGVVSETLLPVNMVSAAAAHAEDLYYVAQTRKSKLDLTTLKGAATDIPDEQLIVVVVVGESARADHFGLNGYARTTTPILAAIPGLVSFTNARSCASATRISVPCLMTRATELDPKRSSKETSLISMFRHFGFDTAWISTNQIYGTYDTPVTAVANEAQRQIFPITVQNSQHGTLDEELLEPFVKFLARPSPRKLVVLHQRGSHWNYHDRYPQAFQIFTPTCQGNTSPSACEVNQLINGYDNSILYTDHVLGSIIGALGEQNALFLYTSDHGQSLGEDGHFLHGAPERLEQRHVPMIWWASDLFRQQHPTVMSTLLSKRTQPVSHDHVFHSVLGCAGFHGTVIDESLNLCAP